MSIRILKFDAEWCSKCSQQEKLLEGFDAAPIERVDVDRNTGLASKYGVRGIPMLVLERSGEEMERWRGVTQPAELESAVEEYK